MKKIICFLGASNSSGGNTSRDSNRDRDRGDRGGYHHGNSNNLGLAAAQLLAKPEALTTALTTLASLSSLGSLGGGLLAGLGGSGSGHVTGVHRRGVHRRWRLWGGLQVLFVMHCNVC